MDHNLVTGFFSSREVVHLVCGWAGNVVSRELLPIGSGYCKLFAVDSEAPTLLDLEAKAPSEVQLPGLVEALTRPPVALLVAANTVLTIELRAVADHVPGTHLSWCTVCCLAMCS